MELRSPTFFAILLLCVLNLSGCLNPTKQVELGLETAANEISAMMIREPCCEMVSEIDFHALSKERLVIRLPDDDDRTRLFNGAPSYFFPISLPNESPVETILIRSAVFNEGPISGIGRVFVPRIQFFNENFEAVGVAIEPGMCFLRRWSEIGFFMSHSVDTSQARHAIVYTTAYQDRELIAYSDSVTVAAGFNPATVTSQLVRAVTAEAELEVWLAGEDDRVLRELRGHCHVDFPLDHETATQ